MKKRFALLLALTLLALPSARADDLGEIAYLQALKDLQNSFRMMCVAAHPDDEDGATLAYYRMLHGVKTFAVIATRGEGGQNEIGPELYNELGVIRTREMKAAAEIEGAELRFLDLPEFGYSKTPEETFAIWGRETALERMVRQIRETRPHVIITNHGRMNDHGHHQAIGAIVEEAFDAAADPARFPEHSREGLSPWQVSRLYIRDFRGGAGTVATNISALEPVRGRTIAEIAASALEAHRSQGMAQFINLLLSSNHQTYYNLVKTKSPAAQAGPRTTREVHGPLFADLPLALDSPAPPALPEPGNRAGTKRALLGWLKANAALRDGSADERECWQKVNRAAAAASELRLRATAGDTLVTRGQRVEFKTNLSDFGEADAISAEVTLRERHGIGLLGSHRLEVPLHESHAGEGTFAFEIPESAALTLPLAPRLFEPGFLEPQLEVHATVFCGEGPVELVAPLYLDIAPPLSISFPGAPYLVRAGANAPLAVDLLVTNNMADAFSDYVAITAPDGWSAAPQRASVSLSKAGEQRLVSFSLTPPASVGAGDFEVRSGVAGAEGRDTARIRVVSVAVPEGRRVGVIQSYDTTFVNTLKKLGVDHETLAQEDFRPERLDLFDTIIVDIRAYQYRPDLVANNGALLDYVERGGTLLVMYQKTFDWAPEYAPYPLTLSRNRVTREDAPVTLLVPDHRLFTTPNSIRAEDWDGWLQERGLYFADSWNERYTALLQVDDPGESVPPGSCLITSYGKGTYFYTALGWYRQLQELHPGALRCFANMLAM